MWQQTYMRPCKTKCVTLKKAKFKGWPTDTTNKIIYYQWMKRCYNVYSTLSKGGL